MRFTALVAIIIGILLIAGCAAEERRGTACSSDSECSWCAGDFVHNGECDETRKTCGIADTISCKKVIGPNGTCAIKDDLPTCVEKEQSAAETPSTPPEFSDLSAYPPCEDGGTCHQYEHCDTGDGINTLMTMDCIRGHCVPGAHIDCKARYGVICVEAYLTQHGQMMKDANGQLMTGGVCAGHANER